MAIVTAVLTSCGFSSPHGDYSEFATLPVEVRDKIVWDLHERHDWGLPEHKPICRDLLMNQGYRVANAIAWTTGAIDLAEKQGWSDLKPLISTIYQEPRNIWVYGRAFRYLRLQGGNPIVNTLVEDTETLREAGYYRSTVTDDQLQGATERLVENTDKEAVLVYVIGVAAWNSGKGGTDRGRLAAVDVLRHLPREDVTTRIRQLQRDCEDYMQPEIEWVAAHLNVELEMDKLHTPEQG